MPNIAYSLLKHISDSPDHEVEKQRIIGVLEYLLGNKSLNYVVSDNDGTHTEALIKALKLNVLEPTFAEKVRLLDFLGYKKALGSSEDEAKKRASELETLFEHLWRLSDEFKSETVTKWPKDTEGERTTMSCIDSMFGGSRAENQRKKEEVIRYFPQLRTLIEKKITTPAKNIIYTQLTESEIADLTVNQLKIHQTSDDGNCGYHAMLQTVLQTFVVYVIKYKTDTEAKCYKKMTSNIESLAGRTKKTVTELVQNARIMRSSAVPTKFDRDIINALKEMMLEVIAADDNYPLDQKFKTTSRIEGGIHDAPTIDPKNWMTQHDLWLINNMFGMHVIVIQTVDSNLGYFLPDCMHNPNGRDFEHVSFLCNNGVHFEHASPNVKTFPKTQVATEYMNEIDEAFKTYTDSA